MSSDGDGKKKDRDTVRMRGFEDKPAEAARQPEPRAPAKPGEVKMRGFERQPEPRPEPPGVPEAPPPSKPDAPRMRGFEQRPAEPVERPAPPERQQQPRAQRRDGQMTPERRQELKEKMYEKSGRGREQSRQREQDSHTRRK